MTEAFRPEEPLPRLPRRPRPWQLLLFVGVLGGMAVAITLFLGRRPEPLRVLVAIDVGGVWWQGSRASAALSSSLAARLERLGFDAVRPGDPEVNAALAKEKSVEGAVRRVRASFLIKGTLVPETEDFASAGGQAIARSEGPLSLAFQDEPAVELGRVESWATAKTPDEAVIALAESLGDSVFDRVFPALFEHRTVRELVERGDAAEKGRLARAKGYADLRRSKLDEARRAYEKLASARDGNVRYHGPGDRNAGLCGAGAAGFLTKIDAVTPFYSPDSRELAQILLPERVAWVAADGKERNLFTSYGLHGYAAAAPAGAPVVVVEDLFGWGRAVTAIDAAGQKKRLRVDVARWPSDPKVAPGGGLVALWERGCRGCPPTVVVLDAVSGAERHRGDPAQALLGGFAWLDAQRLALLERSTKPTLVPEPTQKPAIVQTLTLVDFGRSPPLLELLHEAQNEGLSALAASTNGRFLALARRAEDGKELAVFDVTARSMATFTALAADNPALSARGDLVAYERGGDIALLERATGQSRQLTNSADVERYPLFSADDASVVFESRAADPVFTKRTTSVIASVRPR
jgi:hypothetical protein